MKKLFCLIPAVLLAAALLCVSVFAEAENKVTTEWKGDIFKGTMEVTEEDGVKVYTFTPDEAKSWISPTIDVTAAVKAVLGDRDGADVMFTFEIRGIFEEEGSTTSAAVLIRGRNGTKSQGKENTDQWLADYEEALDGEDPFFMNEDGNIMGRMKGVQITDEEWTLFESDAKWISRNGNMDEELVKVWVLCMDSFRWDTDGLKAIQVRNAGVYDYEEYAAAHTPEPTPTPAPTVKPTEKPTAKPTEKPADQPTDPATEAPATDPGTTPKAASGFNPVPVIVSFFCGAALTAVVCTLIVTGRKKK